MAYTKEHLAETHNSVKTLGHKPIRAEFRAPSVTIKSCKGKVIPTKQTIMYVIIVGMIFWWHQLLDLHQNVMILTQACLGLKGAI